MDYWIEPKNMKYTVNQTVNAAEKLTVAA